jgi:hypothetical protein
MVRDPLANIVRALKNRGFEPRRIGSDLWESRCPGHESVDHALAIKRAPLNELSLQCCGAPNCPRIRILRVLRLTGDRLYHHTHESLSMELGRTEILPASFGNPEPKLHAMNGATLPPGPTGSNPSAIIETPKPEDGPSSAASPHVGRGPAGGRDVGLFGRESPSSARRASLSPWDSSPLDVGGEDNPRPAASAVGAPSLRGGEALDAAPPSEGPVFLRPNSQNLKSKIDAEVLVNLAGCARTFRAPDGRYYASVPVDGHLECHELGSPGFRHWLTRVGFTATRRLPPSAALASAASALAAKAQLDGADGDVFIRVAPDETGASVILDLGDSTRRVVEIRPDGWEILARSRVHFRRASGQLALPAPARDGSVELLRKYVNVPERDFPLLVGWVTMALRGAGPFPIAVLTGEQGSAKSTLARVCRLLIDPHDAPLRAEPKELRDLMIAARNGWVVALDNISSLPGWLSDGLCRLSTGAGFSSRSLYSNDEEVIVGAQCPVILNGIDDIVRRGDLIDRSIFFHLPPILDSHRLCDRDYWAEFARDYPRLLGGLFDAVSAGIRLWPEVQLTSLPRMADLARWGEAVAIGLGWAHGTFLDAYRANRESASLRALEDSPVAATLIEIIRRAGSLRGTASELLQNLTDASRGQSILLRGMPKTPIALSSTLRRLAQQLRVAGISIEFKHGHKQRAITITRIKRSDPIATVTLADNRYQTQHPAEEPRRAATSGDEGFVAGGFDPSP